MNAPLFDLNYGLPMTQLKVEVPVVYLVPPEGPGDLGARGLRGHARFPGDPAAVTALLEGAQATVDLAEPFVRIREAMGEARKMGVAGRAA